jgi:hypothetical protein
MIIITLHLSPDTATNNNISNLRLSKQHQHTLPLFSPSASYLPGRRPLFFFPFFSTPPDKYNNNNSNSNEMSILTYLGAGLTSILLSIPTLHLLANLTNKPILSFTARSMASFTCLILCAAYGVVASLALRCVGYGGLSQWTVARVFQWSMWCLTGVEFRVQENGFGGLAVRPGVFVGNHQT